VFFLNTVYYRSGDTINGKQFINGYKRFHYRIQHFSKMYSGEDEVLNG